MELISSVTVGAGGAASISFSSIPQTYTDLTIVHSIRNNAGAGGVSDFLQMDLNSDTSGANYSWRMLVGTGSAASSQSGTFGLIGKYVQNATVSTFGNGLICIPNYSITGVKTASGDSVTENDAANAEQAIFAYKWSGTAAITSIKLSSNGGQTLSQYSTAYLYGILKGSGGATVS